MTAKEWKTRFQLLPFWVETSFEFVLCSWCQSGEGQMFQGESDPVHCHAEISGQEETVCWVWQALRSLEMFKAIGPDVSDAPSGGLTLPHRPGRCSRSQRAPQPTGGCKLQIQLLFLASHSGVKRFVFLFSESSPARPHPRQANSPSKGELFYAQTVHCARTSDSNTVEQRHYLKLSHFDAVSLSTGAGTEELRRSERGERTWKSSTLWAKPVLMCQQDTLTAHLQHVHTLLLTHDRL